MYCYSMYAFMLYRYSIIDQSATVLHIDSQAVRVTKLYFLANLL